MWRGTKADHKEGSQIFVTSFNAHETTKFNKIPSYGKQLLLSSLQGHFTVKDVSEIAPVSLMKQTIAAVGFMQLLCTVAIIVLHGNVFSMYGNKWTSITLTTSRLCVTYHTHTGLSIMRAEPCLSGSQSHRHAHGTEIIEREDLELRNVCAIHLLERRVTATFTLPIQVHSRAYSYFVCSLQFQVSSRHECGTAWQLQSNRTNGKSVTDTVNGLINWNCN
jgi:hypothetical protein